MKILAVRSLLGALGAFLLLQSYSLLLFYIFVGSIKSSSGPESILDMVSLVLILPVLIMMETVMISEIRSAIKAGIPFYAGGRWERLKILISLSLAALYILLLFKPGYMGFPDISFFWAIAYQLLHFASAVTLGEAMTKSINSGSVTYARHSLKDRLHFSGMFVALGCFCAACAFIPAAPFWTFLALGSTFLTWGLILMLVDDFQEAF